MKTNKILKKYMEFLNIIRRETPCSYPVQVVKNLP